MGKTLGVMLTMTTYGTWLRGDRRGWVDDGKVLPADAELEDLDRRRMDYPPFYLNTAQQIGAGALMGRAVRERIGSPVWAMAVESWHVHIVTGPMGMPIGEAVKEIKLAVAYGLHVGRPMWSDGYDKRWCFGAQVVTGRVGYVERHNIERGLPARRWGLIEDCPYG